MQGGAAEAGAGASAVDEDDKTNTRTGRATKEAAASFVLPQGMDSSCCNEV